MPARSLLTVLVVAAVATAAPAQCIPGWTRGFVSPGTSGSVNALAVFDDGTGTAVYAGGVFNGAGGVTAKNVARWDGTVWTPVASGLAGAVRAFAPFDSDGPGPEPEVLFAGGDFTGFLRAWDGAGWGGVPSAPDGLVRALAVYDDGSGPALYVGGDFLNVGNKPAAHIARWDGVTWKTLSTGISGSVYALAVYDDGDGPALYAGGLFIQAGGQSANRIARWNGLAWSALGSGTSGAVTSLAAHDDGSGLALYAGGLFNTAGGNACSRIARWNGTQWSALDGGVSDIVYSLAVHTAEGDADLYAGGQFTQADGKSAAHIARWEGPAGGWVALGGGADNNVLALTTFEDAGGTTLVAGGDFIKADGGFVNHIAQWREGAWSGLGAAVNDLVKAVLTFDDGSGPAVFAAGEFLHAGGVPTPNIGRWNGSFWSPLGSGFNDSAAAMAAFDAGVGPELYVGGEFTLAGEVSVKRIARWDGAAWSDVSGGVVGTEVLCLRTFDDGAGDALYAGGLFTAAGGNEASNNISRWNGINWSPLQNGTNGAVRAIEVFDDGGGASLFAAGTFNTAGEQGTNNIARWNGLAWSKLGSGINNTVYALVTFDDGAGPALYATGTFTSAGGNPVSNIARWNGLNWSNLGTGLNGIGRALAVHDDGSGPALYAAGEFTQAGGKPAARIAKWDGLQWSALDSGINGTVFALASHDEDEQSSLFAGGDFTTAGEITSSNFARWGCQAPPANLCETSSLTDPDAHPTDFLGRAVAISGDTLIAGAFGDDTEGEDAGALHIYTRAGARWSYTATVVPDDIIAGDFFGAAAAIDGDYALVGSPRADPAGATSGAVYVLERSGGVWTQAAKLAPNDGGPGDQFGFSVSLRGDTAIIGAWKADLPAKVAAGAAYIYVRQNGAWVQKVKLTADDAAAGDNFGTSVAISDLVAVVGAPGEDAAGADAGAGYTFFRIGDEIGQWNKLVPDDADDGDGVGANVAADDKRVLLGAPNSDRIAVDAGAVYVYRASAGQWVPEATLNPIGSEAGDAAGFSVAISGTRALVGSLLSDLQGLDSGAVTMYTRDGIEWFELANLTGQGILPGDWLGASVAIAPGFLAAGALHADGPGGADQGLVMVYSTTGCPCYADFTGDDVLDLFDFLEYVNAFNANQPAADCDASGGLDLFDFLCFANAFNAGC
jgi:trimeric autotransporter adhesin